MGESPPSQNSGRGERNRQRSSQGKGEVLSSRQVSRSHLISPASPAAVGMKGPENCFAVAKVFNWSTSAWQCKRALARPNETKWKSDYYYSSWKGKRKNSNFSNIIIHNLSDVRSETPLGKAGEPRSINGSRLSGNCVLIGRHRNRSRISTNELSILSN